MAQAHARLEENSSSDLLHRIERSIINMIMGGRMVIFFPVSEKLSAPADQKETPGCLSNTNKRMKTKKMKRPRRKEDKPRAKGGGRRPLPEGEKKAVLSIAFFPDQAEWLKKQPNRSEVVREAIKAYRML